MRGYWRRLRIWRRDWAQCRTARERFTHEIITVAAAALLVDSLITGHHNDAWVMGLWLVVFVQQACLEVQRYRTERALASLSKVTGIVALLWSCGVRPARKPEPGP